MIFFHQWEEFILGIIKNIWPIMAIIIEPLLVIHITKAFLMKLSMCCTDWDPFANFEMDLREQLKLQVFLESFWHFFINNVVRVFFSFCRNHFILCECSKLLWIYWLLVWMNICSQLGTNFWVTEQHEDFHIMAMLRLWQLTMLDPIPYPLSHSTCTLFSCKSMCNLRCFNHPMAILHNHM